MDSVQEFAVVTSRIKAEYARAGGGAISIITKSGTNEFHGSGFWFFRDKSLNAETEPQKIVGEGKPDCRRTQFGGTIGGPISQDKSLFFVTYERVNETSMPRPEPLVPKLMAGTRLLVGSKRLALLAPGTSSASC